MGKSSSKPRKQASASSPSPPTIVISPASPAPITDDPFQSLDLNQLMILPDSAPQDFKTTDLVELNFLDQGGQGRVFRMMHKTSKMKMAVKKVRVQMNRHNADETNKTIERLKREIKAIQIARSCPYIVQFYGAAIDEINGDCWICMELMTTSLYHVYENCYKNLRQPVPEEIIGFCAVSVLRALDHVKSTSNIIHRDMKPANILFDMKGNIKLCDFGISGILIDSLVMSHVGTTAYLAPERFVDAKYGVRSDVWSLGITLLEAAIGRFPYEKMHKKMKLLEVGKMVRESPAPTLPVGTGYSTELDIFLKKCLQKDADLRPNYVGLMQEQFYLDYAQRTDAMEKVAEFVERIL